MNNKRITQFFLNQVGESPTFIYLPVRQKVSAAGNLLLDSQENGLYNIFHIYKCQILPLIPYGEVRMLPDGFCHQEIVCFPGTVYPRRTIDDIRKTGYALNVELCFQLA